MCIRDSLNAMEVLARLEDLTGRLLRISDLYACRSAERLSRFIGGEQETGREERHKAVSYTHLPPSVISFSW